MNRDDVRGMIAQIEKMGAPPAWGPGGDPESVLAAFPELGRVSVAHVAIDSADGVVVARHYRPAVPVKARFMWVHGGAFIAGDLDMPESHWVALSLAAEGIEVLAVDYRKAIGGVRFPAPSDDVLAAWRWARAHLGSDVQLGGASAGASLAASVTTRLRDAGEPLPSSLVLVYPLVHSTLPIASAELAAATVDLPPEVLFEPDAILELNRNYAGDHMSDSHAFPGDGDGTGFPDVYILNVENDVLRASGEKFAAQLVSSGVHVKSEFEPGARHGHLNEPGDVGARRSLDRIVAWLLGSR
jgi:acetyl esterase